MDEEDQAFNKNKKNSKGLNNNRRNEKSCCDICKRNKKISIGLGVLFGLILIGGILVVLWFSFDQKSPAEELDLSDFEQDPLNLTQLSKNMTTLIALINLSTTSSNVVANKLNENSSKTPEMPKRTNSTVASLDTSPLIGTWELIESTNFDEYMEALGVNWFTRIAANAASSTVTILKNGDKWQLKLDSTFKSSDTTFTEGIEFDDKTMDGRKVKTTMKFQNPNKLVQEEKDRSSGKIVSIIIREVDSNGRLVATLRAGKVTCLRIYKRI